jgi:hypothetical protein
MHTLVISTTSDLKFNFNGNRTFVFTKKIVSCLTTPIRSNRQLGRFDYMLWYPRWYSWTSNYNFQSISYLQHLNSYGKFSNFRFPQSHRTSNIFFSHPSQPESQKRGNSSISYIVNIITSSTHITWVRMVIFFTSIHPTECRLFYVFSSDYVRWYDVNLVKDSFSINLHFPLTQIIHLEGITQRDWEWDGKKIVESW